MPSFYIYSAADVGLSDTFANWFASPTSTVSGTGTPDVLEMSDDDLLLENEGAGSNQLLTQDLYIDGVLVGSAGDEIINLGQSAVTNSTTGESGYLIVLQVNGVAVGYASTITLNPGDHLSMSPWGFGSSDEVPYGELEPGCFTRGTLIQTRTGDVAIESLTIGQQVWTRDDGFQKIRWIGTQNCKANGRFAPVCFKAGILGNNRNLIVSPMHRMLITGWRAELLFGTDQVLAHARDLINDSTIIQQPQPRIDYFHLMFDSHQIVMSAGALSESFHPFSADIDGFSKKTRDELLAIFPTLESEWPDVLPTLTTAETMLLQTV